MSVYEEILKKKEQDRIRYELEQRKEEIKELDKEIDRRRSINYDLSLQIIDKDKEIERLHSIINEVREYIENKEFINYKKGLGNFERMLKHRQELLEILDKVEENK